MNPVQYVSPVSFAQFKGFILAKVGHQAVGFRRAQRGHLQRFQVVYEVDGIQTVNDILQADGPGEDKLNFSIDLRVLPQFPVGLKKTDG